MKYNLILWGITMASLGSGYAQSSSLYFNKIYEGKEGKPVQVLPAWSEFSVNGEGAKVTQDEDGDLCVGITPNTVFGYMLPLASVGNITSPYAVECALRATKPDKGMDLDFRTPEGEQVSFTIQNQYLIDRMGRDTVCRSMDNSQWSVFRFVMDTDQQTKIYRNGVFLSSLPRQCKDRITDPGFEQSSEISPVWWWSSWSQVTLDGNSPHSGNKSLHWENGWTGQLGARIPVQPNAKYRLTYWAKAVRVNASQSMMKGVLRVGGVDKATLNIPAGGYQQFVVEFTTGNQDEAMDMEFHNGWGDADAGAFAVYIDDMELTRLEGEPYIQFGKMQLSGEADFALRYIAVKSDEEGKPVQYSDVAPLILQAKMLLEESVAGLELGDYPQYAIDRLQMELKNTETLTAESSYESVDAAYACLQREINRFRRCQVTDSQLDFSVLEVKQLPEILRTMDCIQLLPSGVMNNEEVIDPELLYVTYASEGDRISVDENGLLTARKVGEDVLVVTVHYKNAFKVLRIPVKVELYEMESITAVPYEETLRLGDATGIKVSVSMTGGESADQDMFSLHYESLTPEIAEVNANGNVIAKTSGKAIIKVTARFMEQTMSTQFDLPVITVDRVRLEIPGDLKIGSEKQYTLKGYYTDGSEMQLNQEDVVIYSNNRNVIRIDDRGAIFADRVGEATVVARIKQATSEKECAVVLNMESPLSIPLHSQNGEYVVYPNPAKDKITIKAGEDLQCSILEIVSLGGDVLLTRNLSSDSIELDISILPPGTYLVLLKGKQTVYYQKLIVL